MVIILKIKRYAEILHIRMVKLNFNDIPFFSINKANARKFIQEINNQMGKPP